MYGNSASPGHKSYDLIPRNRRTAFGKPNRQIMDPLYDNSALRLDLDGLLRLSVFFYCCKNLCICQFSLMVLLIQLDHLIDDLAFLQPSMSYCCKHRFPVTETVLSHDHIHVIRFHDVRDINAFCFAIGRKEFLALYNIFFLKFIFKPLIDFVLGLCTFYHAQPVPAWAFGILGGQNLHPIPVLDLVINGHQLTVDPGPDHLISHCTVNAVCKVDRGRSCRKVLDLSCRGKAIYTVRKQIQIAF